MKPSVLLTSNVGIYILLPAMEFAITALKRADDSYLDFTSCRAAITKEGCPCKMFGRGIMQQKATQSHPIQSAASLILHQVSEVSRRFNIVTLSRQIEVSENLLGKSAAEVPKDLPGKSKVIDVAIRDSLRQGRARSLIVLWGKRSCR
jgi:hypothetical protein